MVMMILFVSLPQNKDVVTYDTEPLSEDDVKQMWSLNRDTDWIDMYVGLGKVGLLCADEKHICISRKCRLRKKVRVRFDWKKMAVAKI